MNKPSRIAEACWILIYAVVVVFPLGAQAQPKKASITITEVPAYDEKGGPTRVAIIKGKVEGAEDCKDCKVVLFAYTNTWWVQPVADSPDTAIVGGKFQSETHLGTAYAALLVKSSFKAPPTILRIPGVGGDVLAVDTKVGLQ